MAKQRFTAHERLAIWTAYDKRCFICSEPVGLREARMDHIIPEIMADRADQLLALLRSLGLPDDFDVQSYRNIACGCDRCNSDKRDTLFPENSHVSV
jgi:hypothetical protein